MLCMLCKNVFYFHMGYGWKTFRILNNGIGCFLIDDFIKMSSLWL